ncbi:glycoside hydrolase family 2 protein [Microbacteriaceae bacterium VKM Ac-2855]|nr:glycoside hydrolase family 2 protein [Microbacteriaceae bacterium VKM Ac-2855]
MPRSSFNQGWAVRSGMTVFSQLNDAGTGEPVTLPHDGMLSLERSSAHALSSAYFPGGALEYRRTLTVPAEWRDRRVTLHFEGVYRDAVVAVNGGFAGQRPNGYTAFSVPLDPFLLYGEDNTIVVEARAHQDSRWYSGLGIHRDVSLSVTGLAHLVADGVRISTPEISGESAIVALAATVANEDVVTRTLTLRSRIVAADGTEVSTTSSPVTVRAGESEVVRQRVHISEPLLWGVEHPHLYRATTELWDGDERIDDVDTAFGVRSLSLDPAHGLRINGETVKLRGACIHHDNGLLGAAAIGRAEERRIQILKEAGFNAIRASHNPLSTAMIEACDRLGMLVMDETFDMWTTAKNPFDYSLAFPEWWERDVESLVAKDYNHPSVILYSIGNEVLDAGNPHGARLARHLAEKFHALDPTRYTTNAVSGFVATITQLLPEFQKRAGELRGRVGVNDLIGEMHHVFDEFSLSETVTDRTEETHSVVDVVGQNYAHARYLGDRERFPDRVVVGTETLARDIDELWALVTANPHVIGDFTWTGWDYLGEVGLGVTRFDDEEYGPFPALLAWCGDIDITGYRRPASYYREIVFGLSDQPYLAVDRPRGYGRASYGLGWAWTDSLSSWDLAVEVGTAVPVEIYSSADEVELLLNGRSVGTAPAGAGHRFRASFTVPFEPGELVAVARTAGEETGRATLRTPSGPVRLDVTPDRSEIRAEPNDLAYVTIELRDTDGVLATAQDLLVHATVEGPGVLQGMGSTRPVTEESFLESSATTFEGRALAIIRPTGAGEIVVTVSADGHDDVRVTVIARESGTSAR